MRDWRVEDGCVSEMIFSVISARVLFGSGCGGGQLRIH